MILDYGLGNLASVDKAFRYLGIEASVSNEIGNAEKLVIPGVGAFGAAMAQLWPIRQQIQEFAARGNLILGICLGQQLLFDWSEEYGHHDGLGLISGSVRYLQPADGLKIPHMGWNGLNVLQENHALTAGIKPGSQVYFVHSLVTECADKKNIVATSNHGQEFAAIVAKGNVWGCQFHPEKSGVVGLEILRAFALTK